MNERETVVRSYADKWRRLTAGENAAQLISETANMFDHYYADRGWGALIKVLTQEDSHIATMSDIKILGQYMNGDGLEIVQSMFRVVLAEMANGI